jgi:hypothetical protein
VSEDGVHWVRASKYPELFRGDAAAYDVTAAAAFPKAAVQPVAASSEPVAGIAVAPETPEQARAATQFVAPSGPPAEWLYSKNGEQFGPFTHEQLLSLVESGQVASDDLVWKNGLAEWMAVSQVSSLAGDESDGALDHFPDQLVRPLYDSRPWLLLTTVLCSVGAAAALLGAILTFVDVARASEEAGGSLRTVVGVAALISAIVFAAAAVLTFKLATRFGEFHDQRDERALETAFASLKLLIIFAGAVAVTWTVVLVVGSVLAVAVP